jgi:hypothetical protein
MEIDKNYYSHGSGTRWRRWATGRARVAVVVGGKNHLAKTEGGKKKRERVVSKSLYVHRFHLTDEYKGSRHMCLTPLMFVGLTHHR